MPIQEFVDEVRPFVTGCSDIEITHNVLHVLSDFCTRTWCWQVEADPITTTLDAEDYAVAGPEGTRVVAILRAQRDGAEFSDYNFSPPYLTLPEKPTAAFTIDNIRVAVRPTTKSLEVLDFDVPGFILDEYGDIITQGSKGRLMAMPDRKWFYPDLALAFLGAYNTATSKTAKQVRTRLQARPDTGKKWWF